MSGSCQPLAPVFVRGSGVSLGAEDPTRAEVEERTSALFWSGPVHTSVPWSVNMPSNSCGCGFAAIFAFFRHP